MEELGSTKKSLAEYVFGKRKVRIIEIDGDLWFVAKDVCGVLGLENVTEALRNLDDDEILNLSSAEVQDLRNGSWGGASQINLVNEPGVYRLIFQSRKPEAKAFKRWVFHEVLPAIRKQGYYALQSQLSGLRKQYEGLEQSWCELNCKIGELEDPVETAKRELRQYIVKHFIADENPNHYEDADYCYRLYGTNVENCLSMEAFLAEVCAIVPGIRVKKRKGRHWSFLGLARSS